MTGTDLCVNKPHCAAASKCLAIMVTKKGQSRSYLNHLLFRQVQFVSHCSLFNVFKIHLQPRYLRTECRMYKRPLFVHNVS